MTDLLDYRGAAQLLGLTVRTLRSYNHLGILPDPDITVGGSPAWQRRTLERWAKDRKAASTAHEPIDWSGVVDF